MKFCIMDFCMKPKGVTMQTQLGWCSWLQQASYMRHMHEDAHRTRTHTHRTWLSQLPQGSRLPRTRKGL